MKIKFLVSTIALALMFGMVATGQRRRQMPRAKPSATPSPSPTPTPTPLSTLSIEVGVILKSGDVKPVARTTFYLVDEDLKTILDRVYTPPESFETNLEKMALISGMVGRDVGDQKEIKLHTVATTITDFSGKARFTSLQPGNRFLFGMFRTSYTTVAWHLPIQVLPGKDESMTLDNNNAVFIKNQ